MSQPVTWTPPKPLPPFNSQCGARWDISAYVGLETSGHILLEDGSGGLLTELALVDVPETPIAWEPPLVYVPAEWWSDIPSTRARVAYSPPLVNPVAVAPASRAPVVYTQASTAPVADDPVPPRTPPAWSPPIPH